MEKVIDMAACGERFVMEGYAFESKNVKPINFKSSEQEAEVKDLLMFFKEENRNKKKERDVLKEILSIMRRSDGYIELQPDGRVKLVLTDHWYWWGEDGYVYDGTIIV